MTRKACFKLVSMTVVYILAFVGCSNSKLIDSSTKPDVNVIDITIAQEETYEINDLGALDAALNVTSESSDGSVAVLREGKYIYALRPGNTLIAVNDGTKTENYNVTVTANNSTSKNNNINYIDLPKDKLYIGCGFNALEDDELNMETILNNPILDIEKIYQSENFYVDDTVKLDCKTFSGSSTNEFLNSVSKKTTVQAKAKLFGFNLFSIKKEFSDLHSDFHSEFKSINQLYITCQHASYWFVEDENGYESYLLPEVEKRLKGEDGTSVEDFIDFYGTHFLVGGNYGTFFECDYVLSDAPTSPHNCPANELIDWGNYANNSTLTPKTFDYNQWLLQEIKDEDPTSRVDGIWDLEELYYFDVQKRVECHSNEYWDLSFKYTDSHRYLYRIEDHANFIDADIALWYWADSLEEPHYPELFPPLIGPRNSQSLIPVWNLLSPDYKARKNEFINYVSERVKNMQN